MKIKDLPLAIQKDKIETALHQHMEGTDQR